MVFVILVVLVLCYFPGKRSRLSVCSLVVFGGLYLMGLPAPFKFSGEKSFPKVIHHFKYIFFLEKKK